MRRDGWPALCIHGDKGQSEREWALSGGNFVTYKAVFRFFFFFFFGGRGLGRGVAYFLGVFKLIFSEFKTGKVPILLATDVAARGLGMYEH